MNADGHTTWTTYKWGQGNHGRRRYWRANCTCGWRTPHYSRRPQAEHLGNLHVAEMATP